MMDLMDNKQVSRTKEHASSGDSVDGEHSSSLRDDDTELQIKNLGAKVKLLQKRNCCKRKCMFFSST